MFEIECELLYNDHVVIEVSGVMIMQKAMKLLTMCSIITGVYKFESSWITNS